jgi:WD40 repeat protein
MPGTPHLDSQLDGTKLLQHSDPEDWVLALTVSGKGNLLATGGRLGNICIWEMSTLNLIRTLDAGYQEGIDYDVSCSQLTFHRYLPYFAFIEGTGTVCVIRTDSWHRLLTLGKPEDNILSIAFSLHSAAIAFGCQDGRVCVWDIAAGRELFSVVGNEDPYLLSFSFHSKLLCITCTDGTCQFASWGEGSLAHRFSVTKSPYACAVFSPYGSYFLSVSETGLTLRDAVSFHKQHEMTRHIPDVSGYAVSWSAPSFAVRSSTGLVVVWDYCDNSVVEITTPPGLWTPICYSPSGKALLVGRFGNSVRCVTWDKKL